MKRREFLSSAAATAALSTFPRAWAQSAPPKQAKVDIHVHLGRDRQEMPKIAKDNAAAAVKYLIGEMDKHHVEKALIVAVEPLFPTEVYLEAAKLESERLRAACSVIPRPANEAVEKLKAYRDRGAAALKLQPAQYDPKDPAVERLVAEAVRLNMPVLFHHTDMPKTFPDMLSHFASSFPRGNFVVIHFGGVYGFWDVLPLARLPNVYLETSTAFARIVRSPLKSMLHFLSAENQLHKMVFGSELPGEYETVISAIEELLGPSAKEDVRKAIYKKNAEKILRLTISARAQEEDDEREKRDKVPEIITTLGIKEGSRVGDVGAGGGFFTVRLAQAVGKTGRVLAVDSNKGTAERLSRRIKEDEIENVEVIQGDAKDPKLPANSLDAVLIVDAYHEMKEHQAMLEGLRKALKPGAPLVIVDRQRAETRKDPGKRTREEQTESHEIALSFVEQEVRQVGFEIGERRDPFLERGPGADAPIMWMLVARRPN